MFRHILVPLDGSARSEQVLPVAARVARACHGTITLLRVVDLAYDAITYGMGAPYLSQHIIDDELTRARQYLEQWRQHPLLGGTPMQTRVMTGNPAVVILAQAGELPVDLIVMSSHGYTGMKRWLLGSVAERVARHSLAPVLILRDEMPLGDHSRANAEKPVRALVPLDTSPRSLDALAPAAELVAALSPAGQGALHLVQVVVPSEKRGEEENAALLAAAEQHLASMSQSIRDGLVARFEPELHPALSWSVCQTDDIAEGIVQVAEHGGEMRGCATVAAYDLIALTTHGSSGMHWWPVGSIAERVLRATTLPIFIVRPEDMIAKERQRHNHFTATTA